MGRKGVSKRKPKKVQPAAGSASSRATGNSPVQSLMNDNRAPVNTGGGNVSSGSNKKQKKGN